MAAEVITSVPSAAAYRMRTYSRDRGKPCRAHLCFLSELDEHPAGNKAWMLECSVLYWISDPVKEVETGHVQVTLAPGPELILSYFPGGI